MSIERIRAALGIKLEQLPRDVCGCLSHIERPRIGKVRLEGATVEIVGHDRHGNPVVPRSEINRVFDKGL